MKYVAFVIPLWLMCACHKAAPATVHSTDITAIHDITDSLLALPHAAAILNLYDFASDTYQAAKFRYVLITDKNLNPVSGNAIEDGAVTEKMNAEDEVNYRERLIQSFYAAVRSTMHDFPREFAVTTPLSHSECYCTIATELCRLAESKASQRILVIYSDLAENGTLFDSYSQSGRALLASNPEKLGRLLQRAVKLPEHLQGVTVYFIYTPPDRESDLRFSRFVALYKRLLRERGATVYIQATDKQLGL